jgi:hypothetical protein
MVLALFAPEVCPGRFVLLIMHLSSSACSIQILYYCVLPVLLGIVQGRSVFLIMRFSIGACRQKRLHDDKVTSPSCQMQRCCTIASLCGNIETGVHEKRDQRPMTCPRCVMKLGPLADFQLRVSWAQVSPRLRCDGLARRIEEESDLLYPATGGLTQLQRVP